MDEQTAKAIGLLYEASVEIQKELTHLTRLLDNQQRLISALDDIATKEHPPRLRVVSDQIEDADLRAAAGLF